MLSLLGLFVIFMAISFSLARVAIKSVPDYTSSIESIVSEQLGFKVEVGFLDAEIRWLVPRLNLIDVNVFDKSGKQHLLHFKEIDLSLDWLTTIKTRFPAVGEITLVGLKAQVGITEKSQLVFQDYIVDEDIDKTLNSSANFDAVNSFKFSKNLKNYINNLNFKILDSQLRFFDFRKKQKTRILNNFNLQLETRRRKEEQKDSPWTLRAHRSGPMKKSVRLISSCPGIASMGWPAVMVPSRGMLSREDSTSCKPR